MTDRLTTLRECAELARDLGDAVLLEGPKAMHDKGQRRMANRIVKAINKRIVREGGKPVEI